MGNLEKVLIVIILATIAVITALAFLDSGGDSDSDGRGPVSRTEEGTHGPDHGRQDPAPLATKFGTRGGDSAPDPLEPGAGLEIPPTPEPAGGSAGEAAIEAMPGPGEDDSATAEAPTEESGPTAHGEEPPEAGPGDSPAGEVVGRRTVPEVPAGGGRPYLVRPGDTFRSIAAEILGDPTFERWLREANRDVVGPEPEPNTVLYIPLLDKELEAKGSGEPAEAAPAPPRDPAPEAPTKSPEPVIHLVKKGETLIDLSRQYFGSPGRWKEIFEANRDQIDDPGRIRPGMKLRIPTARR